MAKTLVLAEKPSVARDIARVLGCKKGGNGCLIGDRYIVTWALGHLVTLADPEVYGDKYKSWRMEDLPMLPDKMKLVVIGQTSKQYKAVSALLSSKEVDKVVIATDAGREGELVARWILIKAGCKKPVQRLWISSQTDKAIREGFASLKPGAQFDNLFRSAQSRAQADWLVGLNVTRALTCKHNAQLSAGRVQTPTLAMIVKREEEILKFRPKDYFTVKADFGSFTALYKDSKGQARFFDAAQAQEIMKAVKGQKGILKEVKKQYKFKTPPAAYDLTELQRDANKKYGYSAKQTLSYMQSLYETHKLLTYPRTDSRYITKDVAATLPERLRAIAVGQYKEAAGAILRSKPVQTKYIVNDSKVTDHHAIIPTEQYVELNRLTRDEMHIYDLVVRRFLAVLSAPYEYDEVQVKISFGRYDFYAKGQSVKSAGWKALYDSSLIDDTDDSDDMKSQSLPQLNQGAAMTPRDVRIVAGKTSPPSRYTEATLLTAMENPGSQVESGKLRDVLKTAGGLGTPATRADIIEKLFDSFYVERRGREIFPTSKGRQLVNIVPADLKSAELTAKWEQRLSMIANGTENDKKFVDEMRRYASALVSSVKASDAVYRHDNITREVCPECGKYMLEVNGKKGKMLVCQDRECGYRKSLSVITNARCPECHKKLEMRGEGEKKMFYCSCGYREKLSDFNKRKESAGAGKRDVENYMRQQSKQKVANNPFADLLANWSEED
ncbi:MAG: DNA topoisomerase III [Clostridia bacterium]|jgi:DNA topoisomerase-3|nr:DNA topoisomerase III [Clostridia bacterium]